MPDDLRWRIDAIEWVLARLPMHAARWPCLDDARRSDVRSEWSILCMHVDHIRWNWRRYSRGELHPDWWVMIQLQLEEQQEVIDYMGLSKPIVNTP